MNFDKSVKLDYDILQNISDAYLCKRKLVLLPSLPLTNRFLFHYFYSIMNNIKLLKIEVSLRGDLLKFGIFIKEFYNYTNKIGTICENMNDSAIKYFGRRENRFENYFSISLPQKLMTFLLENYIKTIEKLDIDLLNCINEEKVTTQLEKILYQFIEKHTKIRQIEFNCLNKIKSMHKEKCYKILKQQEPIDLIKLTESDKMLEVLSTIKVKEMKIEPTYDQCCIVFFFLN